MKSDLKQLQNRGQLDINKLEQYLHYSKQQLINLLNDDADIRTLAIHILSLNFHSDCDYSTLLLNQLEKETALYTKIEIQNQLSQYGNPIEMCSYLGKIGHNQYKIIPSKISLKKSYPLPRDLIARSLSHMNIEHFNQFFDCLSTLSYHQLLEAIDVLGFICFYHQQLIDDRIYQFVQDCIHQYHDDSLMLWKLITCLSAFPQAYPFLEDLKNKQKHPTLLKEIERSLHILELKL